MNRGGWLAPSLTLARSFSFFREHDEPTLDNNNEAPRSSFFISSVGRSHSTSHAIPLAQCLYEDGAHDARGLCYFLIFVASALLLKRVGPAAERTPLYPIVHKYYISNTHTHTTHTATHTTQNAKRGLSVAARAARPRSPLCSVRGLWDLAAFVGFALRTYFN